MAFKLTPSRSLTLCLVLGAAAIPMHGIAQSFTVNAPPIGLPANGTFSATDFDSINMQSGNVHISIPLLSRLARGKVQNSLSFVYDNQDWEGDEDCSSTQYCITDTVPGPAMQWSLSSPGLQVQLTPNICGSVAYTDQVLGPAGHNSAPYLWEFYSFDIVDQNNTKHHMVPDSSDSYLAQVLNTGGDGITTLTCSPLVYSNIVYAVDGSGISYDAGNLQGVNDPQMTNSGPFDISGNSGSGDSNGNGSGGYYFSAAGGSLVGEETSPSILDLYYATPGGITYYDTSASTHTIGLTYVTQLVDHAPLGNGFTFEICQNDEDGPDCTDNWIQPPAFHGYITLLKTITLPNGQSYQFNYDPTFGDLTSVQLPTGGSMNWTYEQIDPTNYLTYGRAVRTRTLTANPGDTPLLWQYVGMESSQMGAFGGAYNTSEIDPLNQTTNYAFDQYGNQTLKQVYDSAGNQLDQVASTVGFSSICSGGSSCDQSQVRVLQTDHKLFPTGQVSSTTFDYDGIALCWFDNSHCKNIPLRQLTSQATYDYGAGAHGALLRQETTSFSHIPNTGIFDRPLTHSVTGPNNSSSETFQYDNYGGAGLLATAGVPSHDYQYHSSSFTARGNVTTHSVWDSSSSSWLSTTYTYDDLGNRLTSTDPKGNITQFSYDDVSDGVCNPPVNTHAYVTLVTDALGHRTKGAYNYCTGQIAEVWDENQLQAGGPGFRYSYDYMKQQAQVTDPLGGQTTWSYNGYANPLTVTTTKTAAPDPDIVSMTIHDGLGRVVQSINNPNGPGTKSIVDTTYDELGRVHSVSNPYSTTPGGGNVYTYDALDRKTNVLQPDGTNQHWTYTGNITTYTDEAGNSWSRTSDAVGRLTNVSEPGNLQTVYAYDGLSNLTGVTQQGNGAETPRTRSFTYDSLSQLLTSQNPETGTICYGTWTGGNCQNGYDANGNLLAKTDARGIVTSYTYDALNRMTNKRASDGSDNVYYYDSPYPNGIGRLGEAAGGSAAIAYFYDTMGRSVAVSYLLPYVGGSTIGWTTAWIGYDLAGNPTALWYPDGRNVSRTYDSAGRLATVTDATGTAYFSGAQYTAAGALASAAYGNGVTESITYNSRLQPCHTSANSPAVAPISGVGNVYDRVSSYANNPLSSSPCNAEPGNNGNIGYIADNVNVGWTQSFAYDGLNRLTSASRSDAGYNHTYNYDSFGNLLIQDNITPGPSYNINPSTNQLNRWNAITNQYNTYTYDAAGNLINSGTSDIGGHTFTYDGFGRINAVDSGATAAYGFNGIDERIFKQTASGWTDYMYLNSQPIAEWNSTGIWTDYIYAEGQKIAKVATPSGGSSTVNYYLDDHLGTTQVELSSDGHVLWQGQFTPFGSELPDGSTVMHYKFTGKERDTESGLDYFGARYYGSSMGRFMSPDWSPVPASVPFADLTNPQTLNLYSYVNNNPLTKLDPNGHDWFYVDKKWQWQKGHTFHDGNGNATKDKGYAGLLVATKTGVNAQGATTYHLTLYDQNKVVGQGDGFSGNNHYSDTGNVPDGNYHTLGRLDPPPTGQNPSSSQGDPPQIYGYQKIFPSSDPYLSQVLGAYGPIRARLNPLEPGQPDGGYYLHGQGPNGFHEEGWTHGCLSTGRDSSMIFYMQSHIGSAGVSVDTQVVKP